VGKRLGLKFYPYMAAKDKKITVMKSVSLMDLRTCYRRGFGAFSCSPELSYHVMIIGFPL